MKPILRFFKKPRNIFISKEELRLAIKSFSIKQWLGYGAVVAVFIFSVFAMLIKINNYFVTFVPDVGGTLHEGIVGKPAQLNPIFALSDADRDVTSLVYSGLLHKEADGSYTPDIAQSYTVSNDDLTYTFTLAPKVKFSNNKPVTSGDVVYTIQTIQNPATKSPRKTAWEGVSVSAPDEKTVVFKLKRPFARFLDLATTGIVPESIWGKTTPEQLQSNAFTIAPIGTGPYKISKKQLNADGAIDSITLSRNTKNPNRTPNISKIVFNFYEDEMELEKALLNNSIDQAGGINPKAVSETKNKHNVYDNTFNRVFGLFINQNKSSVFSDQRVIRALDLLINREQIVQDALYTHGQVTNLPVPPSIVSPIEMERNAEIEKGLAILENAGWQKNISGVYEHPQNSKKTVQETVTVKIGKKTTKKVVSKTVSVAGTPTEASFTITTLDTPELRQVAELIQNQLHDIGINVSINYIDQTTLHNDVIRNRNFEVLLYAESVSTPTDMYAFWHSSQRKDPGLNITEYADKNVDKFLESLISETDIEIQSQLVDQTITSLTKDMPAIFLYSPSYIYITDKHLTGYTETNITLPKDRFASVSKWALTTQPMYKIFNKTKPLPTETE
ncbi:MAG: ABC transporter substrate-binding protein [Minisyncoccia bacterium]